jgi:transcriptional regulator with PAS, ATPase and Fis domain
MATSIEQQPMATNAIQLEPLFEELYRRASETEGSARASLRSWVELAEAWRITCALREHRGNRSAAARALGIGRRTLYSKMERLGIGPTWSVWGANGASR